MVVFITWLVAFAPAYFGGQGEITHMSWEAVPSTRRIENRWLHSVDYTRKLKATERVMCALECSKLIEAMGGRATRIEFVPGWWEGVSNPSVQMTITGLSAGEADYLAAAIGEALYQDGVGYHVIERAARNTKEANILSVSLTGAVTVRDLAALQASLDRRFGNKAWGVAMISKEKGLTFLNVSGGELGNEAVLAWATESLGSVFGNRRKGGIGRFSGTTGFQGSDQYSATLRDDPFGLRRRFMLFMESSRKMLAAPAPKHVRARHSRDAFAGLRERLDRGRCLCLN